MQVTVLEAAPQPGLECSAVSAGGMQRSNPVLSRESWSDVITSWLLPGQFQFFHIVWSKVLVDPLFLRWFLRFSRASLLPDIELETRQREQFRFTLFALERMHELLVALKLEEEVGLNSHGAIRVLSEGAPPSAGKLSSEPVQRLTKSQCVKVEPHLATWPEHWAAGDWETESFAGNSEKFTAALARECRALGVELCTNTRVVALEEEQGRVAKIITEKEVLDLGAGVEVVVAAGAWTPLLLATMGYFCPVYPMKGYSVAMDLPAKEAASTKLPGRMLIDGKLYVSRLGNQVNSMATLTEVIFKGEPEKPRPPNFF